MMMWFQCFIRDLCGATAIEYALMAAGVALAISAVVFTLGDELLALFQEVQDGFSGP